MTSKQKTSSGKSSSSSASTSQRQSTFFISGDGIDREVITTDICRYLGNDALVKPGVHQDANTGRTQDGFYITAYRPPTSAQLADLRADSQKWREERARTARSPGGYDQSATQQQVRMREDPRSQGGGSYNAPATYEQMTSSMAPPMGVRTAGYEARVAFPNASMAPPAVSYRNPPASQYSEMSDYTYSSQPPNQQSGYSSMESNRDRMEIPPGQPPWNTLQGSSGYASSGPPQLSSGYGQVGRQPAYNYPPGGGNPSMPPYGRGEASSNYDYPPRDSGLTAPNPPDSFYTGNDDEQMDYEEPPAQGPVPPQGQVTTKGQNTSRRDRDRDNRDRHEEPRQKHRHR